MGSTVAFLVPVYQSEKTIKGCLDSILGQTQTDFEVVVVDDGSTDNSAAIVDEIASKDSRVRLVRNRVNAGVAHSLNVGVDHTDADLVARLDADDEAATSRLQTQLERMKASPAIGVCGSFVTYIGRTTAHDRLARVPVEHEDIQAQLRETMHSPFYHPSVMFRRSLVLEAGGYRTFFKNAEDYDLWLRLSRQTTFANIPLPLTRYRLSTQGATMSRLKEQRLYALLAKRSAAEPHRDLADLWTDLTNAADDAEMAAFARKEYRHFAAELVDLGYPQQAFRLLVGARRELGNSAAARFAASQTVARLKARIGRRRMRT